MTRNATRVCAVVLVLGACTADQSGLDFSAGGGTGGGLPGSGGHPASGGAQGSAGAGGANTAAGGSATGGTPGAGGSAGMAAAGGDGGLRGGAGGRANGGSGGGATAGAGGGVSAIGCSDATREAFTSPVLFPDIAGCSGGWSVPGVTPAASPAPTCNRVSGNSSMNPNGGGCAVEDLCAPGWHVCTSAADVSAHSPSGCVPSDGGLWITRQTATMDCQPPPAANNLVGCGYDPAPGVGWDGPPGNCGPMNRMWTWHECDATGGVWQCVGSPGEAATVIKTRPQLGGVICCRGS